MKKLFFSLPLIMLANSVFAQATGTLQVNGPASKVQLFQKVKAIRCESPGKCDAPVTFDLNKAQALPAGDYVVGYENSLYPGLVQIQVGSAKVLQLQSVSVPPAVKGQKIRVSRDLSDATEQRKVLLSFFQLKQHFFRLEAERFGDLYLTGSWDRDYVRRFDYSLCGKIQEYRKANSNVPDLAVEVCQAWVNAKQANDLAPLFVFYSEGNFEQRWVSYPGDVFITKMPRHLVSVPVTESDSVSVFPGAYRFQSEDASIPAVSVRVGL